MLQERTAMLEHETATRMKLATELEEAASVNERGASTAPSIDRFQVRCCTAVRSSRPISLSFSISRTVSPYTT